MLIILPPCNPSKIQQLFGFASSHLCQADRASTDCLIRTGFLAAAMTCIQAGKVLTRGAPLAQRHMPTVWCACRQRRQAFKDAVKEGWHAQANADMLERQEPAQQGDAKDPQEREKQAAYFAVVYSARAPGKVSIL